MLNDHNRWSAAAPLIIVCALESRALHSVPITHMHSLTRTHTYIHNIHTMNPSLHAAAGCVSYHLSSIGLFGVYFILIIVHIVSLIITVYYTDEIPLSVLRRGSTNSSSTGLGSGNIPSTRRVRDMSDRSGSSGSGSYRHRDGDAKDVGDADTVTKANATLFDSRAAHKDNTYINDHDDDGNDDNNEEEDVMAATHRFLSPKDEDELFLSNDSGPATGGSSADSMTQAFRDFCVLTFHTMVVSAFVELKTKQEQRDRRLPHSSSPPSSGPETCMGTLRSARDSFCLLVCSFYEPLLCRDFRIVFMTRFIIQLGVLTVQEYLQYYLEDAIGPVYMLSGVVVATNAQEAVTILFMPVLLGALISSIGAGYISDRFGGRRKLIVYWSGALMGAACLMFSITRNYSLDMFLGLVFGIGKQVCVCTMRHDLRGTLIYCCALRVSCDRCSQCCVYQANAALNES